MTNNFVNDILEHFRSVKMGVRKFDSINDEFLTISIKNQEFYGLGILNKENIQVHENFSNVRFETKLLEIDGQIMSFLVLSSTRYDYYDTFAQLCADFAELGENNQNRERILADPYSWWDKWKELVGNVNVEREAYSVVAELWALVKEIEKGHENIKWTGPSAKNNDIEGELYNIEIKSSLSQFKNTVTVSNQFQLDPNKKLYLLLIKMQESSDGLSINDLVDQLRLLEQDEMHIEQSLGRLGMQIGSRKREKKYDILEARRYLIDDNFPRINAESFKDGKIPVNVKKIIYEVDLTSLEYEKVNIS